MGLFNRKKVETPQPQEDIEERGQYYYGALNFATMGSMSREKALQLDAVYAAVNSISNSVAMLPINVYKVVDEKRVKNNNSNLYSLLNYSPDLGIHNHFNFFKILTESIMLRGNGYALIDRDENLNVKRLQYVDADYVTPLLQADGSLKYIVAGLPKAVDSSNMIHLYMHIDNTGRGKSVIKYAANSLKGVWAAEEQATSFFESGANISGILKATGTLNNTQKQQIRDSWNSTFGSGTKAGVAILPNSLEYQPLSVNPEDAQLLQSRRFDVLTIARWFNIPPSKLMELDGMNYNAMEYCQLSYLTDTIMPYIQLFEDEFNRKLFKPSQIGKTVIDFDFTALLKGDKKSEAEYYRSLINNGIMSINEVRGKLGLEPIDDEQGGNAHFMQISYGVVKDIAEGRYIKQQEQEETTQQNKQVTKPEQE